MQDTTNAGLDYLLDFDGIEFAGEDGLLMRFDVKRCPVTVSRPLGIKYSLTLHDQYGTRLLGFDNAHAIRTSRRKPVSGQRFAYDHVHRTVSDKGQPFEVVDCTQLLNEFFAAVEETRVARKG